MASARARSRRSFATLSESARLTQRLNDATRPDRPRHSFRRIQDLHRSLGISIANGTERFQDRTEFSISFWRQSEIHGLRVFFEVIQPFGAGNGNDIVPLT